MCMLNSLPLIMTAVLLVCIPFEAWAFGIFVNIFIIGYNSSAKIELALVMDWSGVYGPRLCSSFLSLELFHSAPLKPRSTRTSNEAKQSYEED